MRTKLLFIFLLLSTLNVFSQNIGDYRSKAVGPSTWHNANSWEVYNGTTWVNATNYPGQVNGTYNVEVIAGHVITVTTNINNLPNTFGTLTVNGEIRITNNQNAYLNATAVVVTNNLGFISFSGQANLYLPANTALTVYPSNNAVTPVYPGGIRTQGNCTNSQRIYIGTLWLSSCQGAGNGPMLSFDELMETNGSLTGVIDVVYNCTTASLTPRHIGSLNGTSPKYRMVLRDNNNVQFLDTGLLNYNPSSLVSYPINIATDGVYKIDLTFSITYPNNTSYSNLRKDVELYTYLEWDGAYWTPEYLTPSANLRTSIEGDYNTTLHGNLQTCNLKIKPGANIIVAPNTFIEVTNDIVNNGSLTVENNGSLVQRSNTATFTGNNITVKRTSRPMRGNDYVYWGSPVEGNVMSQFNLFNSKFIWQAGTGANWIALSTTTPNPGRGFITRVINTAPYNTTPTAIPVSFVGKPNTGIVSVPVNFINDDVTNYGNYNLLANPYPSGISAQRFIEANQTLLTGTIHFWTSVTVFNASGNGQYNVADYATWNLSGPSAPPATAPGNNSLTPTGIIASGQGFFVQAKANGTAVFNNTMRELGGNNQFFRSTTTNQAFVENEKHRIWLTISNSSGNFRNMMVGYIENASNGFDDLYDGASFTSNNIDFYSVLKDKTLAIQGRALPFNNSDVVALGYKAPQTAIYKIELNGADGMFTKGSIPVYIRDKETNIVHNLRDGAFSFKSQAGTFNNRFELLYENEADSFNRNDTISTDVLVYGVDKTVHISSKDLKIKSLEIFDILGKQVFSTTNIDANEFSASSLSSNSTFLIVKTTLENNAVSTEKIILQ